MNIKTNQTFNLLKEIHLSCRQNLFCWNERDERFQFEKKPNIQIIHKKNYAKAIIKGHNLSEINITRINCTLQGSSWRAIRAKNSPCEGWLLFLVGQKRSSSRLVILKSRPMSPPTYILHLSFMKMPISCTCLLNSIVSVVKYFESNFLGK